MKKIVAWLMAVNLLAAASATQAQDVVTRLVVAFPAGGPATIAAINAALRATLADPAVHERLSAAGSEPAYTSPEALAEWIRSDTAKWAQLIHCANVKVE